MTRQIDSATLVALASDSLRLATLVQFDFDTVIRITDWEHAISALSQTFASSAHLLGVSGSTESSEPRTNSLTIELSGVEQTYIALFLGNPYHGIRARVWKAAMSSSGAVIGDPVLTFDGPIDSIGLDESEDSVSLQVVVSSHWANFEAIAGRKTNHNSQQLFFPGDKGFEFAADTVQDIKWGRG